MPRASFISLKDHKENFQNNPQVRLLNPTKCEIGKISKKILERIVKQLRKKLKLKQWQNTDAVIEWFKALSDKKKKRFIQIDIDSFYPSITPSYWTGLWSGLVNMFILPKKKKMSLKRPKNRFCTLEVPLV